ncbi:ABC transporter permease [Paenibacillus radicis (ex Gao et al. 2016)]|uniref:Sugar ABC transporter permease n=1 Tax=Paenibacillus radicis (ex Gao et al. 2016) TaxID=1737354 RepID=A0A917GY09_9BACL|nr:ABC transporter permease subunit [Paenibacillus radicis (ex Gao et al. 2016)]GGG60746.1 sugar ABC transporter permease [Paenibacillus radicis (ex Gao et al. 2016)]
MARKSWLGKLAEQKTLLLMSVPFVLWLLVFRYIPVWGWSIAFQQFRPGTSPFDQEWVGFRNFKFLFQDENFYQVMRNTLAMSLINLVLGFVTAIVLAILLNELRSVVFKRTVQTISYLPHFISWVVASSIIVTALSTESSGIVNLVLMKLGIIQEPILWLAEGKYFWGILGISEVWKNLGWNTIIYLTAITTIDPAQYEAAEIDGANRLQRILYVTLPGLKSVIVILLILNLGNILESGFEPQYLLGNGLTAEYSDNLDLFVLKYGIAMGNFSLATAAGVFKTVISIILLFGANHIAKRLGQPRLF